MKKLGLVLGGGGALGFAHIGFLKKLEEYNIKPDIVVGCSMGSLIGSLYSLGMPVNYIEDVAYNFNYSLLLDFSKERDMGILEGNCAHNFFEVITGNRRFSDCKIPFYLNAADFYSEEEYIINRGNLSNAIRASTSIPWIFKPVRRGKRILVDGGVADPLPVELARKKGADFIISMGFSGHIDDPELNSEYEYIKHLNVSPGKYFIKQLSKNTVLNKMFKKLQCKENGSFSNLYLNIVNLMSILTIAKVKQSQHLADIYVNPNLKKYNPLSFVKAEEIVDLGYKEAERRINEILMKLEISKIR